MTSSQHRHDHELPLSRLPHIPRPREHEPTLSYLTRLATANATTVDRLTRLLGTSKQPPIPGRALQLNQLAAQRLATLTERSIASLQRAIPTLIDPDLPNDRPRVRCRQPPSCLLDCPRCQLRRDGAARRAGADSHEFLCLRHGAWLQDNDLNDLLDLDALPEIAAAYRRLHRLRRRFGAAHAVSAFRLAGTLLIEWDYRYGKYRWATQLHTRWFRRAARLGHPGLRHYQYPSRWPDWMVLPDRVALAATLIQPQWARRALPNPTRTHRDFYTHLIAVLDLRDDSGPPMPLATVLDFLPLPDLVLARHHLGKLLSDPHDDDIRVLTAAVIPCPELPAHYDLTDNHPKWVAYQRGWAQRWEPLPPP